MSLEAWGDCDDVKEWCGADLYGDGMSDEEFAAFVEDWLAACPSEAKGDDDGR